jgi:hypothetical protein
MEFALVYGNDWFSVPVPTPIGTLARVTTLVVTDTFGVRTLIRPSEQTQVNPGERPWSMCKLSGQGRRSDFITMAPTLGLVDDADALEEVLFLRDDMAAMSWAVEHQLQGDLDSPLDAYEMYLQRIKNDPLPPPPKATADGPKIYYTLETSVPDNWFPMVPVQSPQNELFLRRGTMEIATSSGVVFLKSRALILATSVLCGRPGSLARRDYGRPIFPPYPICRRQHICVDGPQISARQRTGLVRLAVRYRPRHGAIGMIRPVFMFEDLEGRDSRSRVSRWDQL